MQDKQIIIHGVNVSECKKYEHEIIRCNTSLKNMCFYGGRCTDKRNADCYYKQLKRKERECERLKYDNGYEVGALEKTIDNLKAENKHLNELLNQALKDYDRTLNALAEIKEIAKYELNNLTESAINGGRYIEILQKINECEGNNEC